MKYFLIKLLCLSLLSSITFAQKPKYDIEVNFARSGFEAGVRPITEISYVSRQFVSDIGAGISFRPKDRLFVRVRRLPGNLKSLTLDYLERIDIKGLEIAFGYERRITMGRFSFLPALGFFHDYGKFKGYVTTDHPYNVEINGPRHFVGIYPEVNFGFSLSKKMMVLVGQRVRIGYMSYKTTNITRPGASPYNTYNGWNFIPDLISTLALRVAIN